MSNPCNRCKYNMICKLTDQVKELHESMLKIEEKVNILEISINCKFCSDSLKALIL